MLSTISRSLLRPFVARAMVSSIRKGDSIDFYHDLDVQMPRSFEDAEGDGFAWTDFKNLVKDKTVAVFALPGVTGTCNKEHVPSWRDNAEALKAAGVDEVLCVSVNDACTVDAWASYVDPEGELTFVADPSLKFT
jgi:peroxiredoxin